MFDESQNIIYIRRQLKPLLKLKRYSSLNSMFILPTKYKMWIIFYGCRNSFQFTLSFYQRTQCQFSRQIVYFNKKLFWKTVHLCTALGYVWLPDFLLYFVTYGRFKVQSYLMWWLYCHPLLIYGLNFSLLG